MKEKRKQNQTKSTSVESVGWKEQNKINKATSRRGFIMKSSLGTPTTNNAVKIERNEKCHCGSGIKFKKCHLEKQIMLKQ